MRTIFKQSRAEQSRAEQSRAEQSRAEQSRAEWIDFARGMAIVSVIIGHYVFNFLGVLIFAFHIPLFCVISGYLTKPVNLKVCIKRVIRKTIPYYCYTAAIICGISIMNNGTNPIFDWLLGINNSTSYYKVVYGIGPMWHLLAFVIASIVSSLLIRNNGFSKALMLSCVFCIVGVLISKIFILPLQIDNGLVLSVFICFGYWIKQKGLLELKTNWQISIAVLIAGLAASYLIGCQSYASRVYPKFPLGILLSMLLCFAILGLCKKYYRDIFITKYLRWMGRNTMKILAFHTVEYSFILPLIHSVSIVGERHIDSVIHAGVSLFLNTLLLVIITYIPKRGKN